MMNYSFLEPYTKDNKVFIEKSAKRALAVAKAYSKERNSLDSRNADSQSV